MPRIRDAIVSPDRRIVLRCSTSIAVLATLSIMGSLVSAGVVIWKTGQYERDLEDAIRANRDAAQKAQATAASAYTTATRAELDCQDNKQNLANAIASLKGDMQALNAKFDEFARHYKDH